VFVMTIMVSGVLKDEKDVKMNDPNLYGSLGLNIGVWTDRVDEFNNFRARIKMVAAAGIAEEWEVAFNGLSKRIHENKVIQRTDYFLLRWKTSSAWKNYEYIGDNPEAWLSAIAFYIRYGFVVIHTRNGYSYDNIFAYKDGNVYSVMDIGDKHVFGIPIKYRRDDQGNWVRDSEACIRDKNYGKMV